ncbi:unnamed protein product [Phytophthora fragariaefolia]|uniref:Unnamed protein product n=1 Tax=Phytophthora fragariaefolia TaxID=1490495 RepID=A0A9W6U206_9STRA|nr:unnamed protein product [Phytophthora fragariaefolia]
MTHRVRRHDYWHGWAKDVHEYAEACSVCSGGKGHRLWRNGLMQRMSLQELGGPVSLLVVDAVGPLITTPRGKKYILVFVDYFTKWVEALPVSRFDSVTFIDIMINGVITRHEVPETLLSDRRSNVTSELAKALYETLGIKKLFGAAYHPHTYGLVERFNGTLLSRVKMYVNETQSDWDLLLPRLLFVRVGSVGDNAYRVAIPTNPNKIVTINVNRLKPFKGRWRRPFADEVPDGIEDGDDKEDRPLQEDDLPPSSFAEDRVFGGDELVITVLHEAVVDILARHIEKHELQYLVLIASYKTAWCRAVSWSRLQADGGCFRGQPANFEEKYSSRRR